MANYFMHRISHLSSIGEGLLTEGGYLSIGFVDVANKSNSKEWSFIEEAFDSIDYFKGDSYRKSILKRFVSDMKTGDIVLVPLRWGSFMIVEIESDVVLYGDLAESEEKNSIKGLDLGFFRKVKFLTKRVWGRSFATPTLVKKMKYQKVNLFLGDVAKDITETISNVEKNEKHSVVPFLQEALEKQINNTNLTPQQLENMICGFFNSNGAEAFIPAKNEGKKEGDADIIAYFPVAEHTIYIQAKCHSGVTDAVAVEQIIGYTNFKHDKDGSFAMWVITTADKFNERAKELAKEKGVRLFTAKDFASMIINSSLGKE